VIRIANGQGFWGDWLEAPVRLVEQGPIDYLTLDYLAEVTMSILQKQRQTDPNLGYARDFPPLVARIAPQIRKKHTRVIANAGGVNPLSCAHEVLRLAPGLKIAVVLGDDVFDCIDEFITNGYEMRDLDTCQPLATIRDRILAANAYVGAFPIAEALDTGADIVITGRCADPSLALGPMIHRFAWGREEWDKLAAGTIAGHVIECGTQCTGGNCQVDWPNLPDPANIGYPIVEMHADGTFVVTKHPGTGGRVHSDIVKEQLLYELGDPENYMNPDCIADFTSIAVADIGPDHVKISGARGKPRPATIKLSIAYANGWKAIATLVYSWPQAIEKARAADAIVRRRVADLGLCFDEIHSEFFGVNAVLGPAAPRVEDPPEVQLRIGVRGPDRKAVDRFTREMIPLVLNGPPGGTGYGEGRPKVREVVSYWGTLIPQDEIRTRVEVVE
jgi:hypothetical protein